MTPRPKKYKPALWTQLPRYRAKARAEARKSTPKPLKSKFRAIKRRSSVMAEKMKKYNEMKILFLEMNPVCAIVPYAMATEIHHIRGRASSLLLDERFWLPVSSSGHRWIHEQPDKARQLGFLCKRGDWNKPVKSTP